MELNYIYMEKTTLVEIKSDIKYKRDTLHLAHEDLKREGDFWNKIIIFVSLGSSLFESTKMTMKWDDPALNLFPIFLSSVVAGISSFVKFKRYNEQQEVLIQSCTVLTSTLAKARNSSTVDEDLLHEYHEALELLETSLYPDVRKRFLKASQKNLITIIKNEDDYFEVIKKARGKKNILDNKSLGSTTTSQNNITQLESDDQTEIIDKVNNTSKDNLEDNNIDKTNQDNLVSESDLEDKKLQSDNNFSINITEKK
ncbi:MAG: hypothetical protein CMI79_01780 [Candidatus Pelagibacter sp.]|nr:hypothetical protein [Candidatus Pelagibacter sp.]